MYPAIPVEWLVFVGANPDAPTGMERAMAMICWQLWDMQFKKKENLNVG